MTAPVLIPTSAGTLQLASSYRLQVNTTYDQTLASQPAAVWETVYDVLDFTPGTPAWDKLDTTTYDSANPTTGIVTKSEIKVAQSKVAAGSRLGRTYPVAADNNGWKKLRTCAKTNRFAQVRWFNASDPSEQGEQAIVDVTYDRQGGAAADRAVDAFTLTLQGDSTLITNPVTAGVVPDATSVAPTSALANVMVTITGTGFAGVTGVTGVKFGSTNAAMYVVDSNTQIRAVVAGSAGSQPITVTGPGGPDTTTVAFTVL